MLSPLAGEMHKLIYPSQVWYSITFAVVDITLIRAKRGSLKYVSSLVDTGKRCPLFYSNHDIMYGTA